MAAPEVFQISSGPLTACAFSADRSRESASLLFTSIHPLITWLASLELATCANTNDVAVSTRGASGWDASPNMLAEHDKLVTSISWAPRTNRIVTCSQDRNAYVWTPDASAAGGWKPALVLLRINRAATCVKWSPNEDKFAVASGARAIAVCSFDEENNWWVSKHIKKPLRSTVLSIDWHPNNVLLAAGSADAKARVFSAFIKGIDAKPPPSVWGDKLPFNTVCGEFSSPNGGWVHDVAFSPSGDVLAFASHDSSISIVYPSAPGEPPQAIQVIRSPSLPYVSMVFATEASLVAAGHDCQPALFTGDAQNGWKLERSLDDPAATKGLTPSATGAASARTGAVGRLNTEAFNRFKQADSRGVSGASAGGSGAVTGAPGQTASGELLTVHQNTIIGMGVYEWNQDGSVAKFYTCGRDGKLCIWTL